MAAGVNVALCPRGLLYRSYICPAAGTAPFHPGEKHGEAETARRPFPGFFFCILRVASSLPPARPRFLVEPSPAQQSLRLAGCLPGNHSLNHSLYLSLAFFLSLCLFLLYKVPV